MKLQMVQMARLFPVDPILVLERIDAAATAREVLPGARDDVTRPSACKPHASECVPRENSTLSCSLGLRFKSRNTGYVLIISSSSYSWIWMAPLAI
jgi:hypothetical protein